ncbi:hypothetical protein OU787_28415 [Kitasatospora sp. YST-16]|uniref:hypothetical protein n=1 Tax=Kitasatospora sp. YST-16 TaxID=2998080 RepID=UPI002284FB0F|nr:hypothetical protein [Kitasatospora sp. YST-16]WAL75099.1 hypothetical protein OU787_28415 [Kitasatospora sp. YST-16]WNW41157.1 hypothetical protein RKE32_28340 [Streptomyces sp. Li-HN-5-13]
MTDYQLHHGIHRRTGQDSFDQKLTWLWGLGHLIVFALLGVTAYHQLTFDRFGPALAADHESDCGFEDCAAADDGT